MVSRPWGWPALNYVMPTMSQSLGIAPPFLQLAVPKAPPEWTIKASGAAACPGAGRRLKTTLYASDFLPARD